LIYSTSQDAKIPLGVIRLRNAKCTEYGIGFCIKSPASYSRKDQYSAREYYFQCTDGNSLKQWMKALTCINTDLTKTTQTPRRELNTISVAELVLVTNASSFMGLECVKTLLLKKISVIAICSPHKHKHDPKCQLLKKYGAGLYSMELSNGNLKFISFMYEQKNN
jgi:hypothetical protein